MSIEAMKLALEALGSAKGYIFHNVLSEPNKYDTAIDALRAAIEQAEKSNPPREIEVEFTQWLHPVMGVVPVDPKTPLVLKAKIREEV